MKYVSKNANLMVVLRNGIPGNSQLGTPSIAGLYVRFKDGMVDVADEEIIKLMEKSMSFNTDFIRVEENADPYANIRVPSEPLHTISTLDHGSVGEVVKDKAPLTLSPEVQKYLDTKALELAKPMAVELAKQLLPMMMQEMKNAEEATVLVAPVSSPKKPTKTK